MDKELLSIVMERLHSAAPWIKWIDIDEGQLETEERPPVAFPCALLDLAYPECETLPGGRQRVKVEIVLTVAFLPTGQTSLAAPQLVREKGMQRFDQLAELHKVLQWWKPTGCIVPLRRVRCTPDRRFTGAQVYNVAYATEVVV